MSMTSVMGISTATVSMISDGMLMRLPVEDFQRLQTPPQQALVAASAVSLRPAAPLARM